MPEVFANSNLIWRAGIDGAIAGAIVLPLVPMLVQLLSAGFDSTLFHRAALVDFAASYAFLMLVSAPFCAMLGATTAVAAQVRIMKVSSRARLSTEALAIGAAVGGALAIALSAVGSSPTNYVAIIVLPLCGAAFALIVLFITYYRRRRQAGESSL